MGAFEQAARGTTALRVHEIHTDRSARSYWNETFTRGGKAALCVRLDNTIPSILIPMGVCRKCTRHRLSKAPSFNGCLKMLIHCGNRKARFHADVARPLQIRAR
jgi:hypothetical protein